MFRRNEIIPAVAILIFCGALTVVGCRADEDAAATGTTAKATMDQGFALPVKQQVRFLAGNFAVYGLLDETVPLSGSVDTRLESRMPGEFQLYVDGQTPYPIHKGHGEPDQYVTVMGDAIYYSNTDTNWAAELDREGNPRWVYEDDPFHDFIIYRDGETSFAPPPMQSFKGRRERDITGWISPAPLVLAHKIEWPQRLELPDEFEELQRIPELIELADTALDEIVSQLQDGAALTQLEGRDWLVLSRHGSDNSEYEITFDGNALTPQEAVFKQPIHNRQNTIVFSFKSRSIAITTADGHYHFFSANPVIMTATNSLCSYSVQKAPGGPSLRVEWNHARRARVYDLVQDEAGQPKRPRQLYPETRY